MKGAFRDIGLWGRLPEDFIVILRKCGLKTPEANI
jgi:hypothetical protein